MIGIGIIGAVCDAEEERARSVAQSFGVGRSFGSASALLQRDEIDAVTVGVWNAAHAEVAIAALEAGKDVFCEKPMARTAPEAARMAQAEVASRGRRSTRARIPGM